MISSSIRSAVAGFVAGAVTLSLGAAAVNASTVSSAISTLASTVTCSVTGGAACAAYSNTSSGNGVLGKSQGGNGVRGTSVNSYGVKGQSTNSIGVVGQALAKGTSNTNAIGVSGSGAYVGVEGAGFIGTYGHSTTAGGAGLLGMSTKGVAVDGQDFTGVAVEGYTASGTAVEAIAGSGTALDASSNGGTTVYGQNSDGNGADLGGTYIGIIGRAPSGTGSYPLDLVDGSGNNVFYVNGDGDVAYHGTLGSFARNGRGDTVAAYASKTTTPTLEDTGSARLIGGYARVRLEPAFASLLDGRVPYRVFITPGGDTRGLFVTQKAPDGFVVRESQGGRSSVDFDYRIVATALGDGARRMHVVDERDPRPRATLPHLSRPDRATLRPPAMLAPPMR